jgi:transglutaminase-like putative cysteine protease
VRLFYDVRSSRARAEALLIGADAAAVSTAVVYSTAALQGGGSAADIALVPLWASLPRAIARIIESLDRPRAGYRAALGVAALGVLMAALAVIGHGLITSVSPPAALREPFLLAVLLFAWGSGVLLCHPGAYRLHDVLLFSTLLLGLKEAKPFAWILVPLFLGAFFLSCAVRRLVFDVLPQRRDPPWNLQNARAASLVAAAAASAVFIAAALALGAAIPAGRGARSRGAGPETAPSLDASRKDGADRSAAVDGPFAIEEMASSAGSASLPRVGFSYRVSLRDLAYARLDAREVARIAPDPDDPPSRGWRPSGQALWKGITLSSYDTENECWTEESRLTRMAWPADGAVELPHGLATDSPRIVLTVAVVTPVLKSGIQPYVTRRVLSSRFTGYSVNDMGDLFPHPAIAKGTSYRVEVSPTGGLPPPGGGVPGGQGPAADGRYLAVPAAAAVGVDLRALARSIFRDGAGAAACVALLRAHFASQGFRYSNRASWRGKDPIARFLREERIGSCAYFATAAALILRAGGVPSRLAAGFLGGTWDEERGEAVLRNRDAHAWVEVFHPGAGWRPIDPTAWVPFDASYRPPAEVPPPAPDGPFEGGEARGPSEWTDEALDARGAAGASPPADSGKDHPFAAADAGLAPALGRGEPMAGDLEEAALQESWIEYGQEAAAEATGLAGGSAPAPEGAGTMERQALQIRPAAEASRPFQAIPRAEGPGLALRAAIIVAGGAVLAVLAVVLLRPRRKAEDEEQPEEIGDEIDGAGAAARADGPFLDETDPRDRVLADYMRLQAGLARTRTQRRPYQTPVEHGRFVTRSRKVLEAAFRELHGVLYHLVYGGGKIEERHADAARRSCRRIRRHLG